MGRVEDRGGAAQVTVELVIVAAGAVTVALVTAIGMLYTRSRLAGFAATMGGHFGIFCLRVQRGGLTFATTAEPFGRLGARCRKYRTLRLVSVRPRRGASWPMIRTSSPGTDLRAYASVSEELLSALAGDAELQRRLLDLVGRTGLRLRFSKEGLALALRPRGRDLTPRDLLDVLDWLVALQPSLVACGAAKPPGPTSRADRRRVTVGVLRGIVVGIAVSVPFGLAVGKWHQLSSGAAARVLWHAVPVALTLAVPACLAIRHRMPSSARSSKSVANLFTTGPFISWFVVASCMILANHHLDRAPRVTHEVELLEVSPRGDHPTIGMRAWTEGRETEWMPLPNWFEAQLTPETKSILVQVQPGALGYEHIVALGVPER
jgi:hypothetical protein